MNWEDAMNGVLLDMDSYPRKAHFDYFRTMPDPYAGVTVEMDITELLEECREKGKSFFLAFLHLAALTADGVPELRRRIRGSGIVEYPECATSHIELCENGAYCYCTVHHEGMAWEEYFARAEEQRRKALAEPSIKEDEDSDSYLFISCLPWIHYTQLKQPVPGNGSNPRITWGKYVRDPDGRFRMPVSLFVHHALADGVHIAAFYSRLEELIKENRGLL